MDRPLQDLRGVVEPTIQFNDSFENDGQGKDTLIGELASKGSRDILAECLANREEEGFDDADFFDDEEGIGAVRTCGEPHPTIPLGDYGYCTLPLHHAHHVHQTNGPAAGPDSGFDPLCGRQVGEVEAPVGAQLDLAIGRHVGVEQRGEAAPVGVGEDVFPLR